jgi:hypothetical protein
MHCTDISATGWTIGVLGFDSQQGLGIFFTTASRTVLRPTQPPIQWVPEALSLGVKRQGREADHSPPSSAEVKKCVELYIHSPNRPSWSGPELKKSTRQLYLTFYLLLIHFIRQFLVSISVLLKDDATSSVVIQACLQCKIKKHLFSEAHEFRSLYTWFCTINNQK